MKNGIEKIKINGFEFNIGYKAETEFAGYICEMKKDGEWHGVRFTGINNDNEIGWNTGIFATEEELAAIEEARKIMFEKYGKDRWHG